MTKVTSTRVGGLAAAASVLLLLMLPRAHSSCLRQSPGKRAYETLCEKQEFMSRDHLVFWANGTISVGIGLAEAADPNARMYKIVFGADQNSMSFIRYCSTGTGYCNKSTGVEYRSLSPLNPQDYAPFWVQWNSSEILAGNGSIVGVNETLRYEYYPDITFGALLFGGFGANPFSVRFDDDSFCIENQNQSTTAGVTELRSEKTESTTELATETNERPTELITESRENRPETQTETNEPNFEMTTEIIGSATKATDDNMETSTETSESNTDSHSTESRPTTLLFAVISQSRLGQNTFGLGMSTESTQSSFQSFIDVSDIATEAAVTSTEISSSRDINVSVTSPAGSASQTSLTGSVSVTFSTEIVSVTSPTESDSVTSPTESVSVTSPTESVSVTSPTESVSVTSPTESVSVTSPTESVSQTSHTESVSVTSPTESVSVTSPTESVSQTSHTGSVSQTSPTESVAHTSPTESVSQISPTESVSQTSPTGSVSQTSLTGSASQISPMGSVSQTSPTESLSEASPEGSVSEMSATMAQPTTLTPSVSMPTVSISATLKLSQEQRPCACVPVDLVGRDPAVLEQEKQEAVAAIARELLFPLRNVSSYTRSKTSAEDDRDSSAAMGLVGIVACSVPLALVVLMDLARALRGLGQAFTE